MTPHHCDHERITLAFNTILRHTDAQPVAPFGSTRPRQLSVPPNVKAFHWLRTFETPLFHIPWSLGEGLLNTSSSSDGSSNADTCHSDLGLIQPAIATNSSSRAFLTQHLKLPNCEQSQSSGAIICRLMKQSVCGQHTLCDHQSSSFATQIVQALNTVLPSCSQNPECSGASNNQSFKLKTDPEITFVCHCRRSHCAFFFQKVQRCWLCVAI